MLFRSLLWNLKTSAEALDGRDEMELSVGKGWEYRVGGGWAATGQAEPVMTREGVK